MLYVAPLVDLDVARLEVALIVCVIALDACVEVSTPCVILLVELDVVPLVEVEASDLGEDGLQVSLDAVVESLAGLNSLEVGLTE